MSVNILVTEAESLQSGCQSTEYGLSRKVLSRSRWNVTTLWSMQQHKSYLQYSFCACTRGPNAKYGCSRELLDAYWVNLNHLETVYKETVLELWRLKRRRSISDFTLCSKVQLNQTEQQESCSMDMSFETSEMIFTYCSYLIAYTIMTELNLFILYRKTK